MIKLSKQINVTEGAPRLTDYVEGNNLLRDSIMDAIGINNAKGKPVIFTDDNNGEIRPIDGWGKGSIPINIKGVDPENGEMVNIIAVDSSSTTVAETEDGGIYAVKGGSCIIREGKTYFQKIGPFIAYVGLSNIDKISHALLTKIGYATAVDKQIALKFLRNMTENMIIDNGINEIKKVQVLVDGSFKEPPFDLGRYSLSNIIEKHKDRAMFLGISKSSSIRAIRALYGGFAGPKIQFADISTLIYSLSKGEFGRKMLIKMNEDGFVFRADLDDYSDPGYVLASLKKSDRLMHGYPESLKIAHLLSIFTSAEVAGVKATVAGVASKVLVGENMRKVLLGSLKVI
ncbi:MAG: hypothetical protein QXH39_03785 [Conexivisphaerales archaeon]